ncbi:MAG TPA: TolC family protein [Pirellulales bacterium]|nr:TolC family protein [Pirellulales bacterium]
METKRRYGRSDGPAHSPDGDAPLALLRRAVAARVFLANMLWTAIVLAASTGCLMRTPLPVADPSVQQAAHYKNVALEMEYPNEPVPERKDDFSSFAPHVIREGPPQYWDLTLEEALKLAMVNSPVLRDLGGQVLVNPQIVRTVQGPAITETDPNYGVEAALSQFDADLSATGNWQNNHRALNNEFFGGGTRLFQQDLNQYQIQLAKRAATGGQYFLRQNTVYDANNAPANLFPHSWDNNIEAEVRQPLLQGAGVLYNRIAGPNGTIGQANGVLIARVNTDISLAEFELGVRNLISNVENAYWDLYFAYRDLHAKIVARDSALETWRRIHALYVTGRRGGEADKEAQARDQYYFFQAEVEDALTGRLFDGTRTNNGSSGGTFRANPGVYVTERRLRLTMGLPPNDPRLIRPAEEPLQARVCFDWDQLTQEALNRRAELRRQRSFVKRRELELIAARNFLLPRLDAEGLYRWRGFGHNLINYGDNPQFDNAVQTLFGGQFQEWQLGAQFDMPIGFRQGHAAVRNAQLVLARERAILREMELQVIHDLSNVVGDVDRSYIVAQTNYNRRVAAAQQMAAVQAAFEADTASLLDLVESQRRLADADSRYARSMVEYTLAVKNVMFESNTLLENNGINMAEGPWPHKAYHDAQRRDENRSRPTRLSYILPQGPLTDRGMYQQFQLPPAVTTEGKALTKTPQGTAPGEVIPAPSATPGGETRPPNSLPSPGSAMPGAKQPDIELPGPAPPIHTNGPAMPAPAPSPGQEGRNTLRSGAPVAMANEQSSSLHVMGAPGAPSTVGRSGTAPIGMGPGGSVPGPAPLVSAGIPPGSGVVRPAVAMVSGSPRATTMVTDVGRPDGGAVERAALASPTPQAPVAPTGTVVIAAGPAPAGAGIPAATPTPTNMPASAVVISAGEPVTLPPAPPLPSGAAPLR